MLVDIFEEYQVGIPSQAIYINREGNNSNKLNSQIYLSPIFSLAYKGENKNFTQLLTEI